MNEAVAGYPELLRLAARVARLHGYSTVITLGASRWAGTPIKDPDLDFVEIRSGPGGPKRSRISGFHRQLTWDPTLGSLPTLDPDVLARSVACLELDGPSGGWTASIDAVRTLLECVPVSIVTRPEWGSRDPGALGRALAAAGLPPTFEGRLSPGGTPDVEVAIVDRVVGEGRDRAPSDFRVVAVMTAYNEEDIIGPSIEALVAGGIEVHLIDNWSSDRTYDIAQGYLGRGLVGLERFPAAPTPTFDLTQILHRVEDVTAGLRSDWCIHHDADERKVGPWPGRSLRDALWVAQRSGFNAIDQTVLDFRPVDSGFMPGTDYEAHFRSFEFGAELGDQLKIQAWRNTGQRVVLAESGGHEAVFPGRRVFPYKFLLKHYPIRSQAHGERKILVERRARWNPAERARGWHVHYDDVTAGHVFVRDPSELLEFVDGRTQRDYLVPFVSGVGLEGTQVPGWALRGRTRALVYRSIRALDEGRVAGLLRRSILPRAPIARRLARRVRRAIFGGRA